jgi:hypothetical protein
MATKDDDVTSHRAEVPARLIRPRPSAVRVLVVTGNVALAIAGLVAIAGWLPLWVAFVAVAVSMGRDVAPRVVAPAPELMAAAKRHGRNVFRRSLKSHQPQA